MQGVKAVLFIFFFSFIPLFAVSPLPHGYGKIELGMTVEQVKTELLKNSEFGYNGDRDVSLLPGENRILIETDPKTGHVRSFLDRCWFQFYNNKLYIITINMAKEHIDHYSIFSTLCKKYGDPSDLSPEKAVWQNGIVSMSLERPLSLKYIALDVFDALQKQSLVDESVSEMTRDMFLDGL